MPAVIRGVLAVGLIVLIGSSAARFGYAAESVSISPPEAAQEFARGQRLMREGNYFDAARIFESLAGRYPESPHRDLFVFLRAKAKYHWGEYSAAIAGFTNYLKLYPQSPERAYARWFLANAYYRRGDVDRAFDQYLLTYEQSNEGRLERLALDAIAALLEQAGTFRLSRSDFDPLSSARRCALAERLEPLLIAREQGSLAQQLAVECGRSIDLPITDGSQSDAERTLAVAVLLPLSGELAGFGAEIYNGAVIAAELRRADDGHKIMLIPHDTRGDPVDAGRIVGDLASSGVDAVIGPLTSEEAAVASARLHDVELPMLVPAATQSGLTRLSETSFQLSPNVDLQGVRMAEFAVRALGADSALIFSSSDAEHLRSARAFTRRFEQLGGTVMATQYLRSRDTDFGPYIRDVKAMVLGAIADSTFYLDQRGDTIDVDGLPVFVDCIFITGASDQIRLLLPQIHFYNVVGAYLGTDDWDDDGLYRLGDDVTKRATFPSPFLSTSRSEEYSGFAAEYDRRFGRSPKRLAALGYDAMMLLARAFDQGRVSAAELVPHLRAVKDYRGASGTITFGRDRENTEMPLYRIIDGSAVPIQEAPATPSEQ